VIISVPNETFAGENRVAITPETVKKYIKGGFEVYVEENAGVKAGFINDDYQNAGASIVDSKKALAGDIVLKVRMPDNSQLANIKPNTVLIGMFEPFNNENLATLAKANITAFSLEAAPRTSRAQSLDVLSSQANVAGYKAVMIAANEYHRFMPMLMTAAGTVKAARVVVLGVGVAGLQAIATAKRLGAVVEASDVRPSVKEQIESLGAKFIDVPYETDEEREAAEGVGGYARPMPQSWLDRQKIAVGEKIKQADIVISTALIPGRPAPTLIFEDSVKDMKAGSVIVDLAAANGGNCPLTEADKIVVKHGVKIIGYTDLPAQVPFDASALYARNLQDFLKLIVKDGQIDINLEDDIVKACLMTQNGTQIRVNG
jgi:NAD(P) transhydrogenase subunit alpha